MQIQFKNGYLFSSIISFAQTKTPQSIYLALLCNFRIFFNKTGIFFIFISLDLVFQFFLNALVEYTTSSHSQIFVVLLQQCDCRIENNKLNKYSFLRRIEQKETLSIVFAEASSSHKISLGNTLTRKYDLRRQVT